MLHVDSFASSIANGMVVHQSIRASPGSEGISILTALPYASSGQRHHDSTVIMLAAWQHLHVRMGMEDEQGC